MAALLEATRARCLLLSAFTPSSSTVCFVIPLLLSRLLKGNTSQQKKKKNRKVTKEKKSLRFLSLLTGIRTPVRGGVNVSITSAIYGQHLDLRDFSPTELPPPQVGPPPHQGKSRNIRVGTPTLLSILIYFALITSHHAYSCFCCRGGGNCCKKKSLFNNKKDNNRKRRRRRKRERKSGEPSVEEVEDDDTRGSSEKKKKLKRNNK